MAYGMAYYKNYDYENFMSVIRESNSENTVTSSTTDIKLLVKRVCLQVL